MKSEPAPQVNELHLKLVFGVVKVIFTDLPFLLESAIR